MLPSISWIQNRLLNSTQDCAFRQPLKFAKNIQSQLVDCIAESVELLVYTQVCAQHRQMCKHLGAETVHRTEAGLTRSFRVKYWHQLTTDKMFTFSRELQSRKIIDSTNLKTIGLEFTHMFKMQRSDSVSFRLLSNVSHNDENNFVSK